MQRLIPLLMLVLPACAPVAPEPNPVPPTSTVPTPSVPVGEEKLPEVDVPKDEQLAVEMYHAFARERDYAKALKCAKVIVSDYPDSTHRDEAKMLLAELPKREDDFKKFTLPTKGEWEKLKPKLSREEQIAYLASRIRLITAHHRRGGSCGFDFLPNRYDAFNRQFVELPNETEGRHYSNEEIQKHKLRELINPLSELSGAESNGWGSPRIDGLKLTVKDIPLLTKHLKDDWHVHCAIAGKTIPAPYIWSTRMWIATIISQIADHDLCGIGVAHRDIGWYGHPPKEWEIHRLDQWAKDHADTSETDLQWELLQVDWDLKKDYGQVQWRVQRLLKANDLSPKRRALISDWLQPLFLSDDYHKWTWATWMYNDFSPKEAVMVAKENLDNPNSRVRIASANMLFRHGDKADKDKVRPIMGEHLARNSLREDYCWNHSARLLIESGSEEAMKQAMRLFENESLRRATEDTRAHVLVLYAQKGCNEPYMFYSSLFETSDAPSYSLSRAVARVFAEYEPEVKQMLANYPKDPHSLYPALKKWLDGKLKK